VDCTLQFFYLSASRWMSLSRLQVIVCALREKTRSGARRRSTNGCAVCFNNNTAHAALAYVDNIRQQCVQIHKSIRQIYFDYPVETALAV